ncbi:MAG TPA: hypothetical protein VHL79_02335 [Ramlibacter sp.]|jgi:hypothetical protein|nr:hypothetical protein [Ramlibacter sp.]
MNQYIALGALVLAAASGAASAHTGLAGDITVETDTFVSSRQPAEVRSELIAYKKSGVNPWARTYNPLRHFMSLRSHKEVVAEFAANREQVAAFTGEDSGSMFLSEAWASKQRDVRVADGAAPAQH